MNDEKREITARYNANVIGPRRVGGVYRSGYFGTTYRVDAIHTFEAARPYIPWSDVAIVEIDIEGGLYPGHTRIHCTPWDPREDTVIQQPGSTS